jgi:hypothetical protein
MNGFCKGIYTAWLYIQREREMTSGAERVVVAMWNQPLDALFLLQDNKKTKNIFFALGMRPNQSHPIYTWCRHKNQSSIWHIVHFSGARKTKLIHICCISIIIVRFILYNHGLCRMFRLSSQPRGLFNYNIGYSAS